MPSLRVSPAGFALIKAHEGLRRRAAKLATGGWTIGYSHTATAKEGQEIGPEEAERLLLEDLEPIEAAVREAVLAPLTQGQFDALCSLAFNIGLRQFRLSGIVRLINEGRPIDAAEGFDVWRRARVAGRVHVVDALVRRRAAEKALFLSLEAGPIPAPSAELPPVADPDAVYGAPLEAALELDVDLDAPAAGTAQAREAAPGPSEAAAGEIAARLARILPELADEPGDETEARAIRAGFAAAARARPDVAIHEAAPAPEPSSPADRALTPYRLARARPALWRWGVGASGALVLTAAALASRADAAAADGPQWLWATGIGAGVLLIAASAYLVIQRAGRIEID